MTSLPKKTFKGRIKESAVIWQDHGPKNLDVGSTLFTCKMITETRVSCTAKGYGELGGDYGNGSLFVNVEDIDFLSEPPYLGEGI